jgi:protein O-GlcNAc transferase
MSMSLENPRTGASRLLEQALRQHRAGDLAAARDGCIAALGAFPQHAPAHFVLGVIELQTGRLQEGIAAIQQSLTLDPNQPQAYANLGAAHNELSQPAQALACCERALQIAPNLTLAIMHRGVALRLLGRHEEAVTSLQHALRLAPNDVTALNHLGKTLTDIRQFEDAVQAFRRALSMQPQSETTRINLGIVQLNMGRHEEALASFEQALRALPRNLAAHYNRGVALLSLMRPQDAVSAFDSALSIDTGCVDAYNGRAVALGTLELWPQAIADLQTAARLAPDRADITINLARACLELHGAAAASMALSVIERALQRESMLSAGSGVLLRTTAEASSAAGKLQRFASSPAEQARAMRAELRFLRGFAFQQLEHVDEAIRGYREALEVLPALPYALNNLGALLVARGDFEGAFEVFRKLRDVAPEHPYVEGHLRMSASGVCNWDDYTGATEQLEARAREGRPVCLPLWFLSVSDNAAAQLASARGFLQHSLTSPRQDPQARARYSHARIRLGYLSGDFRDHAVAFLLSGVLERHDRERFETIALSLQPYRDSPYARRIRAAVEQHVDLSGLSDSQAAACIRKLEIDVLIDLAGHTRGSRPQILAPHPASIQVNYLGYPGTLGADYADYLLADDFIIPEATRPYYSERIAYLPDCFQANDDRRARSLELATRAAAGLPAHGPVLCCFNNTYKLNPKFFAVWMRLLQAVPDSVLWLVANSESAKLNLQREARARAIAPERIIFAPRVPYEQHLARLALADLFLDTLPFNGGTTVSDALWAGVPVLTCAGEAMAARMGGSLLRCLGFPELVTTTLEDYEQRALELLCDPQQLASLRSRVEVGRAHSPLFNTPRFTRHLEAAFLHMHRLYESGVPAEHFHVESGV